MILCHTAYLNILLISLFSPTKSQLEAAPQLLLYPHHTIIKVFPISILCSEYYERKHPVMNQVRRGRRTVRAKWKVIVTEKEKRSAAYGPLYSLASVGAGLPFLPRVVNREGNWACDMCCQWKTKGRRDKWTSYLPREVDRALFIPQLRVRVGTLNKILAGPRRADAWEEKNS